MLRPDRALAPAAAVAPRVELFGRGDCPYTSQLREHLVLSGVTFAEYDIDLDDAARRRVLALIAGQRLVPVLVEDGHVTAIGWHGRGSAIDGGGRG